MSLYSQQYNSTMSLDSQHLVSSTTSRYRLSYCGMSSGLVLVEQYKVCTVTFSL